MHAVKAYQMRIRALGRGCKYSHRGWSHLDVLSRELFVYDENCSDS